MAKKYAHYNEEGVIQGFYSTDIHVNIPTPNIFVSHEEWLECLNKQGMYKVIDGTLTYAPPAPPSEEQIRARQEALIRYERTKLFDATKWLVERHAEQVELGITPSLSAEQYLDLLRYRQALRDATELLEMPIKPDFIK